MRGFKEVGFADRIGAAAKAKKAQLEKARELVASDGDREKRQAERKAIAEARDARIAERKAARLAEEARLAIEREVAERERVIREKAEKEAREKAAVEARERELALEVDRKAARDARYAARKARGRK